MHPTKIIRINEAAVQSHIDTLARGSIYGLDDGEEPVAGQRSGGTNTGLT